MDRNRGRGRSTAGAGAARWRALPALLLLVLLALGGCRAEAAWEDAGDRVRVVATTGIVGDLVEQIGGDRVRVVSLMGPGVDPHLYKAREGDVRRLFRADAVFYNGLHLEARMGEVLERMGERKPTIAVAEAVDPSRLVAPAEYEGAYDPHVWFDVGMWMDAARRVEEALVALDPAHAGVYRANAAAYLQRLEQLEDYVQRRAASLPADRRVLVTAHDAFGYFGRAYGFEVRGLQGISTASEAGAADVQRLAEEIARRRLPAIFVETSIPQRTVEAVQAAVRSRGWDVRIGGELYSDALGNPGSEAGTYLGMVRHNVDTIVDALLGAPQGEA